MLDGHGAEMSKRAREIRDKKKNRPSIFNKDKKELSRGYKEKFQIKAQSTHQKEQSARKVERLTEYEQTRKLIILGVAFVTFLLILFITVV